MRPGLALLAFLLLPGLATAQRDEAEGPAWAEQQAEFPAAPKPENLGPFVPAAPTDNRFFVDRTSIRVDGDGVVRYVLVVQSPAGAASVSYEGMRCSTAELKVYAFGRKDGGWSPARNPKWIPIPRNEPARQHATLYLDFFCPDRAPVRSADEAVAALRQGGHPRADSR